MVARPYPYASWPKLSRRQRQLLVALRSYWDDRRAEHVLQTARSLLGRELNLQPGAAESCSADQLAARCGATPGMALTLEQARAAHPVVCAVELSHQSAQQLVDLALGGDAAQVAAAGIGPLDELSQGALVYVFARVLAALGGEWTLRDSCELAQLTQQLNEDCVVCPVTLELAAVNLSLRAYVPERLALQNVPERPRLRSLDTLPVTLVARAGAIHLPASAARALAPGDVIVPDESPLVREHGSWRGSVRAGLLGSRNQLECTITDAGLEVESFVYAKEHGMSTGHIEEPSKETGNAAFASDTPIELQVEIARFSLTLGELQRLQIGDVLVTGRRIGERVSVRVSGQTFADGELVDVDGEVGVRLLSIASAP